MQEPVEDLDAQLELALGLLYICLNFSASTSASTSLRWWWKLRYALCITPKTTCISCRASLMFLYTCRNSH